MNAKQIKLTFVGDVMCEEKRIVAHNLENDIFDFNQVFAEVSNYFESSDYVVANLETPLAGKDLGYSTHKWSFNSPTDFAIALKQSGVDLVSTANNHCLDRGVQGLKNTIKELERIEFRHVGTNFDNREKRYIIEDIEGIRVGFFSYTYGTNAFFNQNYLEKDQKNMVNLYQEQELSNWLTRKCYNNPTKFYSRVIRKIGRLLFPIESKKPIYERNESSRRRKAQLIKDIKDCRKNGAEFIIMLMHAGGQYNSNPTRYTLRLSDFLIKHGVDVIIGNHEHVVQRIDFTELVQNKIKAYSLGNFSSMVGVCLEPFDKMAEYSIVFNIYITKDNGEIRVENATFSIAKSILISKDKIKTVLLYNLIEDSINELEKEKLLADNLKIINTFLNTQFEFIENKKEYNIFEILNNSTIAHSRL